MLFWLSETGKIWGIQAFWSCSVDFPHYGDPLADIGHMWGFWRTCGSKCRGEGRGIFPTLCVECCLVSDYLMAPSGAIGPQLLKFILPVAHYYCPCGLLKGSTNSIPDLMLSPSTPHHRKKMPVKWVWGIWLQKSDTLNLSEVKYFYSFISKHNPLKLHLTPIWGTLFDFYCQSNMWFSYDCLSSQNGNLQNLYIILCGKFYR